MQWVSLIAVDSVPNNEIVSCDIGNLECIVWKSNAEFVVMDARCPHQWAHLGFEGFLENNTIICGAHFWCFDSKGSGYKKAFHGRLDPKTPIAVYKHRIQTGIIEICLDDQGRVVTQALPETNNYLK